MLAAGHTGFVRMLAQVDGMRVMINRVKVLDRFAAMHMAGDDVGGLNRVDRPRLGPWIKGGVLAGT
jgi:hypothetical protein